MHSDHHNLALGSARARLIDLTLVLRQEWQELRDSVTTYYDPTRLVFTFAGPNQDSSLPTLRLIACHLTIGIVTKFRYSDNSRGYLSKVPNEYVDLNAFITLLMHSNHQERLLVYLDFSADEQMRRWVQAHPSAREPPTNDLVTYTFVCYRRESRYFIGTPSQGDNGHRFWYQSPSGSGYDWARIDPVTLEPMGIFSCIVRSF